MEVIKNGVECIGMSGNSGHSLPTYLKQNFVDIYSKSGTLCGVMQGKCRMDWRQIDICGKREIYVSVGRNARVTTIKGGLIESNGQKLRTMDNDT